MSCLDSYFCIYLFIHSVSLWSVYVCQALWQQKLERDMFPALIKAYPTGPQARIAFPKLWSPPFAQSEQI